ncbi:glycosyltransferase family 4 protein [Shewanella sp. OMA3-2]|uniref:glycosyltransferase family 4 protein n=1 Tax=Shewanella sp. OMA3-2 TaxID=2908650 RepID=UPI001F3BA87E|nr:glycosyltransferase family 4 protein [Shewanella sp. OMA3-2]UJF23146.1 glycosyltransferase family 4 protein [Shewanella sp. OMA3-2]
MKKKLLFIVNVDWFFLSHRLPIALAAKQQGYEVHVACQMTKKGEALHHHGFVLHELPIVRNGTSLLQEYKTFSSIRKLVRKINPSLMHAITIKPVLYGGLATRFSTIPLVASISGLGYIFISEGVKATITRTLVAFLYRLALKRINIRVIFQNPTDKQLFESDNIIDAEQALIIRGSGVELDKYQVIEEPKGAPVVMLLARLLIDKGVLEFIEAARLLKEQDVVCRMVLVGNLDENPKSITKHQLAAWVDSGLVEYWGFSSNVNDSYAKSNIVVLPSYREGLPKSLIEAGAAGRAVITTDVPGCRDAITPNVTGILVDVKDAVSLATEIRRLCKDNQMRSAMGKEGRLLAESEFDIKTVISKHLDLYRELTEGVSNVR